MGTSQWNRNKLTQVVNQASKITGENQLQLHTLYSHAITQTATRIFNDPTHPLHPSFQLLPSGRRLSVPMARKNGNTKSFLPSAVAILNQAKLK